MKNSLDKYSEVLYCPYCNKGVSWMHATFYHGDVESKAVLESHISRCSKNPDSEAGKLSLLAGKLSLLIEKCRNQARISECLNCKHFWHNCEWTKL